VKPINEKRRLVLLSACHDYRTAKRASIHHIADGLIRAGCDVSFVSTRFSFLSKWTDDSRISLSHKANLVETVNGVRCFLWRTPLHPFHSDNLILDATMRAAYVLYSNWPSETFDEMCSNADAIVIESSVAAIYLRRLRRINSEAKIIYYATDQLDTIGAHPFVQQRLEDDSALVTHFSLRSSTMIDHFRWAEGRLFRAEFGVDEGQYSNVGPSPYVPGRKTLISVGSMLFDETFFAIAGKLFPDVQFHVIGCGTTFQGPPNVRVYPEMKFKDTLAYIKHAAVGIAPYRSAPGAEYLAESSLKLAQYEYFGLPALCPTFAVGRAPSRFGYEPGNEESIRAAVVAALAAAGAVKPRKFLSWTEVALRVLDPERYPETSLNGLS
jgi:2-beta-glucuronyltransferase